MGVGRVQPPPLLSSRSSSHLERKSKLVERRMADARPRHVLHVMATRMDFRSPASFMDRKKNFFFSNPLFKNRPICFAFRRARFVLEKEGAKRE